MNMTPAWLKCLPLLVALFLILPNGGCKKEPCSGGGMTSDSRALPAPWATLASPPEGAVACVAEEQADKPSWSRHYELGDSPKAGYTAFYDHLKGKGWQRTDQTSDERYEVVFENAGHRLKLFASSNVKDKGWLSVTFTPAKPPTSAP